MSNLKEALKGKSHLDVVMEDSRIKIEMQASPITLTYMITEVIETFVKDDEQGVVARKALLNTLSSRIDILKNELKGDNQSWHKFN